MKIFFSTLSLALRNLLRNRRRSLTTIIAMIIGVQAVLMFGGFSRNITYGLQTDYVRSGGHLQIQRKGYYLYGSGNPAVYAIANYKKIIDAVKSDPVLGPMVAVITPTLQLNGIAGNFNAGVSRAAFGRGVVVEDQNRMRQWNDYHFPGRPISLGLTGSSTDSAVIGIGLARVLQLCGPLDVPNCEQPPVTVLSSAKNLPNDIASLSNLELSSRSVVNTTGIELLTSSARGAPNVAALNVVKAEDQLVKDLDDVFVEVHLARAQQLVYGRDTPKVSAIAVQLKHTNQMHAARVRLEQLLSTTFPGESTEVIEFEKLNPLYGQALAMFAMIFGFVAILIGAIVLFTVSNTMSMAVVERTVEIGTLRAMGLRRNGIRRLFIIEGVLLGMIGSVLGVSIAASIAGIINHSGIMWSPPGRSPVPLIIWIWGEPRLIIGTMVMLILVASLSAWWPARRASRMDIVEALRHV
jgi:putative ABC transport system permease protein